VKLAIKIAAVAGGVLAALLAAGCGARTGGGLAGGPGSAGPVTVQGCAAYGVYAIEHHITVTWKPAPCRGLSQAAVNQAAALAILRVAGGAPKAVWRRRAAEVAPFLSHLITGPAPATSSLPVSPAWSGSSAPASGLLGGRDLAMDIAALVAWLITAGSGSYVLGTWISRGGTLRQRAGATGSPPAVIFGHFGLALGGLVFWVTYLIAGWVLMAWTAVGVLLPVAGLGMATVVIGFPTAGTGTAGVGRIGKVPAPGRLSPLVVAGHGLLAVATMVLVLLASLGTAAS
jgi:manganese efflux pump family protein